MWGWDKPLKICFNETHARKRLSQLKTQSKKVVESDCTKITPNQILYASYVFYGAYMQFPKSEVSTLEHAKEKAIYAGEMRDDGYEHLDKYVVFEKEVGYDLFDDSDEETGEPIVSFTMKEEILKRTKL